jgi:hypothetical protein
MRHPLRRVVGALAGASLIGGVAGTPIAAHAASTSATPGAAVSVEAVGMCDFWACGIRIDGVMAPVDGTLVIDWGDGNVISYTPGTATFEETHVNTWDGVGDNLPRWLITLSVNGGPPTVTYVVCTPPVDVGICV